MFIPMKIGARQIKCKAVLGTPHQFRNSMFLTKIQYFPSKNAVFYVFYFFAHMNILKK